MPNRPILFSAPMVRAILDDRKTQTRRVIKVQPNFPDWADRVIWTDAHGTPGLEIYDRSAMARGAWAVECPYGIPGDQLWVRETWKSLVDHDSLAPSKIPEGSDIQYPATYDGWVSKGRPSIHMCQWMSRITLEVTGVRAERLQQISLHDAQAEGLLKLKATGRFVVAQGEQHAGLADHDPRKVYRRLWDSIHGSNPLQSTSAWDANPWVWVVEFRRIKP